MTRKCVKKNVRKKYTEHAFQLALQCVNNGSSIREAAETFRVPYTTLNSHVNNEITYDKIGRPTKFNVEEEGHLEQTALALQVTHSTFEVC